MLIESNRLLFFTGTPHRGKDFQFLALLQLLRPDLFDPRRPIGEQLQNLPEVTDSQQQKHRDRLARQQAVSGNLSHFGNLLVFASESRFYDLLTRVHRDGPSLRVTSFG